MWLSADLFKGLDLSDVENGMLLGSTGLKLSECKFNYQAKSPNSDTSKAVVRSSKESGR